MSWLAKIAPAGPQVMALRSRKRAEGQARVGPFASAALPNGAFPFRQAGGRMMGNDGRCMFTAAPVPFFNAMPLRPFALLLTALLGLTQCGAGDAVCPLDKLPPATQTGENTAGCLINGQPWTSRVVRGLGSPNGPSAVAMYRGVGAGAHFLQLSFAKAIGDKTHPNDDTIIMMHLPEITQPGTYVLDQPPGSLGVFGANGTPAYATFTLRTSPSRTGPEQVLFTGPTATGRLVVTQLTPAPPGGTTATGVVSGTFEFTARAGTTGPTMHLTEGRFDCSLY